MVVPTSLSVRLDFRTAMTKRWDGNAAAQSCTRIQYRVTGGAPCTISIVFKFCMNDLKASAYAGQLRPEPVRSDNCFSQHNTFFRTVQLRCRAVPRRPAKHTRACACRRLKSVDSNLDSLRTAFAKREEKKRAVDHPKRARPCTYPPTARAFAFCFAGSEGRIISALKTPVDLSKLLYEVNAMPF